MYTYVSNVFALSAAIGLFIKPGKRAPGFLKLILCGRLYVRVCVCVCVRPEAINN